MHGLNHSVIMGKCPSCLIYEERVARLEAAIAALGTELRWCIRGLEDAANARPEHLVDWVANLALERLEYARAALSDAQAGMAGEGQEEGDGN